jgi:hypothetical protein
MKAWMIECGEQGGRILVGIESCTLSMEKQSKSMSVDGVEKEWRHF